ncbi:hypothetical protein AKO1_005624 [Acrasis kona]|uniref:Uncharacterized protein n=1 Tax=Acrasis kona TaxID=1008807 RepID=A0AAW2YIL5_9EUKA
MSTSPSQLTSLINDDKVKKEDHVVKRVFIIEYNTGVVMFDHIFPKAWTTKEDVDVGGWLLSCYLFCQTMGGGGIKKFVLQPPRPAAIESPFSVNVTRQLDLSFDLPTDVNSNVMTLRNSSHIDMSENIMTTRINGATRRVNNLSKSGLYEMINKKETSFSMGDRNTYIVFGKVNENCSLTCVLFEADEEWLERIQSFADQVNAEFEKQYSDIILVNLKKHFEVIKSEVEVDQTLMDEVRDSFKGFSTSFKQLKDRLLLPHQLPSPSSPSKRTAIQSVAFE